MLTRRNQGRIKPTKWNCFIIKSLPKYIGKQHFNQNVVKLKENIHGMEYIT